MDLQTPCNACALINRKPALFTQLFSKNSINVPRNRRKTVSELRTPVAVNGSTQSPSVPSHKVTVHDRERGVVHEFFVPEDQYILHTAEDQNIKLPFACRHGCCTSCAVRVKSGQLRQPEALGISAELKSKVASIRLPDPSAYRLRTLCSVLCNGVVTWLRIALLQFSSGKCLSHVYGYIDSPYRSQGYALLCVGFPSSDLEVETQDEDEVYWLQFGRYFARGPIERDDYALELAMGDE